MIKSYTVNCIEIELGLVTEVALLYLLQSIL